MEEIRKPDRHYNAYYEDNALLIQLMLLEFLATQQLADQICTLSDHCLKTNESIHPFLSLLSGQFAQLLGSVTETSCELNSQGCLTKLKNYSRQFSKNGTHKNKSILPLYKTIYKTWLSALKNAEIIDILQSPLTQITAPSLAKMKQAMGYFHTLLSRISKDLPKIVRLFWENENVMFFIIKKKENFIAVYGSDFIKIFFKNSEKKQKIIRLISNNYTGRGFSHLVTSL